MVNQPSQVKRVAQGRLLNLRTRVKREAKEFFHPKEPENNIFEPIPGHR